MMTHEVHRLPPLQRAIPKEAGSKEQRHSQHRQALLLLYLAGKQYYFQETKELAFPLDACFDVVIETPTPLAELLDRRNLCCLRLQGNEWTDCMLSCQSPGCIREAAESAVTAAERETGDSELSAGVGEAAAAVSAALLGAGASQEVVMRLTENLHETAGNALAVVPACRLPDFHCYSFPL